MLILTIAFFKEIPSKYRRSLQHATSDVSGQGPAEAEVQAVPEDVMNSMRKDPSLLASTNLTKQEITYLE